MNSSSKRIAKNTAFLYVRMLLTMGVALYTSRVVLEVLGASDYGLYNVVGGVVTMLAFINGAMSSGTARFITFELGKGDKERLSEVFNISLICHIVIAIVAFLVAETIGIWFVNTQMVFPPERWAAVNVVYQASIITMVFQFTQIPYSSDIIAHEKMSVYAYVSIIEVTLKLIAILILKYVETTDALITYALMLTGVQLFVILIYRGYCRYNYEESKWKFVKKIQSYKQIFEFSGWDVIGGLCVVTGGQGLNILLNIYFGPIVNAARAISYQVQGAFMQFSNNFMTALNPSIVKSFASDKKDDMEKYINNGSLFSFYLLLLMVLPLIPKLSVILDLWLKKYPEETLSFTKIILVSMMIRAMARPVIMGVHATGNIKRLNLLCGSVGLLLLPVSWAGLSLGLDSIFVFWSILFFSFIGNILEIYTLKKTLPEFSVLNHIKYVYFRAGGIAVVSFLILYFLQGYFGNDIAHFILYYVVSISIVTIIVFFIGLTKSQQGSLIMIAKQRMGK